MNTRSNVSISFFLLLLSVLLIVVIYQSTGQKMKLPAFLTDDVSASASDATGAEGDNTGFTGIDFMPTEASTAASEEPTIVTTITTTAPTEAIITTTTTAAPTTATTAPPQSREIIITNPKANIRSGAGMDTEVLSVSYQGQTFDSYSVQKDETGVDWYEVTYNGQRAFICASLAAYSDSAEIKRAYLTFDDGPTRNNTTQILDILDRYGVKATFFVIYHSDVDDLYRAIVDRGHTLALHSYTHTYSKIYKSTDAFFDDLDKISNHVKSITGVESKIFRFPGGSSNTVSRKYSKGIMTQLTTMIEERGYVYFDWNVSSGDADEYCAPKDKILRNIKNEVGGQSSVCILMHDASAKTTTVDALPEIIEYLQGQGYVILPITADTKPVHHSVNN